MSSKLDDASTLLTEIGLAGAAGLGLADRVEVPALTVLYHPHLRRVGERVLLGELLASREALVSRRQPLFSAPGSEIGEPLADVRLSRHPCRLTAPEPGTVRLSVGRSRTRVVAGGSALDRSRTFTAAEVDRGVVLELAGRVVLLLHRFHVSPAADPPRFGMVGDSSALSRVRAEIERVADLGVGVLLRGETGTGKELAAAAIHRASRRPGELVAVNLGAVPASLASSELFGAVKGAYTGSTRSQAGYFGRAQGGTLFLDEIGEATPEVQVMLLRVLESGEIQPVGSQSPRPVDVRLIAATDADLDARAAAGEFRQALLHRLAGYEILLPALRRRRDDIGRLVVHFLRLELEAVGEAHRLEPAASGVRSWLPAGLMARLAEHDWPGNVRQLRNVVRQLVIGSRGLPRLEIGPQVERLLAPELQGEPSGPPPPETPQKPRRKPATVTEEELKAALQECRFDLKATAAALRISRTSLYALIEKFPGVRAPGEIGGDEIARAFEECGGDLDAMVERLEISSRALKRRLNELGLGG